MTRIGRCGVVAAVALVAGFGLSGCASARHSHYPRSSADKSSVGASGANGHATVGDLTVTGGYIPQPASPDVAAAYLTITNSGATPDTISAITTDVSRSVTAMNETDHDGVGSMTNLAAVTVPAHGRVALTPGHAHLMVEHPTTRLRAGQHVTFTITFTHAGKVRLVLPVLPLTGSAPPPTMAPMSK